MIADKRRTGALCVDGYVRVSRVAGRHGERFISPTVQRSLIEGWASAKGARVLRVFEELDESGTRPDRPLLETAIQRVEGGISQGIVVAKVDRFGRSLTAGIAAIERVQNAGGTFVAVQEGLDSSTETGRLVVRILLSLGEWQAERIRTDWDYARLKAAARGVYAHQGAPVGYRRTRSGRLRPDPVTAEIVVELFRRRVDGETLASLGRWMEAQGIHTAGDNPGWPCSAIRTLLRNRAYLGEVRHREYVNESAHPPLIDPPTWQAAQVPTRAVVLAEHDLRLLARLVHCAGCSMTMTSYGRRVRDRPLREEAYACPRHSAAGYCPAPATISTPYLEAYVEECFFEILRRRRAEPTADLAAAEHAVRSASAALARYRDSDQVLSALGTDAYLAGVHVRTERVRKARLKLAALRDAHFIYTLPPNTELEPQWIDMNDHDRRALIVKVIDCVFVSAGGHQPIEDRVTICRTGTAPPVPRTGRYRIRQQRPFVPRPEHGLPPPPLWSTDRIERELVEFVADKRFWPTRAQFEGAGRRRLHEQIVRHAGVACWAHHVGLPIVSRPPSREPWTERRIRVALELYLRRQRSWPTRRRFEADGLGGLHSLMRKRGGIERWRAEFEMPPAPARP